MSEAPHMSDETTAGGGLPARDPASLSGGLGTTEDPAIAKILIVEDNEMSRDMLGRRLERKKYRVILAADGAEGIRRAREEHPDLILMDLSLPVLDGWNASAELKSDPRTRDIPIIALTAHAMAGDEIRARSVGCDDFETKPVDFARLLTKISALLALRDGADRPGLN